MATPIEIEKIINQDEYILKNYLIEKFGMDIYMHLIIQCNIINIP